MEIILAHVVVVVMALLAIGGLILMLLEAGIDMIANLLGFVIVVVVLFSVGAGFMWAVESLKDFYM